MTCGFDHPHTIKHDVSHVTKYPRLSPFLSIFVHEWESLGTRLRIIIIEEKKACNFYQELITLAFSCVASTTSVLVASSLALRTTLHVGSQ